MPCITLHCKSPVLFVNGGLCRCRALSSMQALYSFFHSTSYKFILDTLSVSKKTPENSSTFGDKNRIENWSLLLGKSLSVKNLQA